MSKKYAPGTSRGHILPDVKFWPLAVHTEDIPFVQYSHLEDIWFWIFYSAPKFIPFSRLGCVWLTWHYSNHIHLERIWAMSCEPNAKPKRERLEFILSACYVNHFEHWTQKDWCRLVHSFMFYCLQNHIITTTIVKLIRSASSLHIKYYQSCNIVVFVVNRRMDSRNLPTSNRLINHKWVIWIQNMTRETEKKNT